MSVEDPHSPPFPSGSAEPVSSVDGAEVLKLDVESLRAGDLLGMQTADGVSYRILVGKSGHAILLASDDPPPALHILLRGGTNADSSEYTPNRIHVGGRLAYAFSANDESLHTTPVIQSLSWDRVPT
jgi:hypothetical protein